VKLIIIAALARNRVIGKGGTIPWHLSEDLKRFKKITMGHTVLMGRITYESIGKPLPGRKNVVITSKSIKPPSIYSSTQLLTFSDLDTALTALKNDEKVFIIGGGQLYRYSYGQMNCSSLFWTGNTTVMYISPSTKSSSKNISAFRMKKLRKGTLSGIISKHLKTLLHRREEKKKIQRKGVPLKNSWMNTGAKTWSNVLFRRVGSIELFASSR
jgi:dihydrofolate reductase